MIGYRQAVGRYSVRPSAGDAGGAVGRAGVGIPSVGIGGACTGIYPMASPGGWNLIGRTPLSLFSVKDSAPALLRAGDHVKFRAISSEEFATWK